MSRLRLVLCPWLCVVLFLGAVPASAQAPGDGDAKAGAASLFREAFARLTNGDYDLACAGFEAGLKLNANDVNAWLYYREALRGLENFNIFYAEYSGHQLMGEYLYREIDDATREIQRLQPSDEQIIAVLEGFYRIRPHSNFPSPRVSFRVRELAGKRVWGARYTQFKEVLERNGVLIVPNSGNSDIELLHESEIRTQRMIDDTGARVPPKDVTCARGAVWTGNACTVPRRR